MRPPRICFAGGVYHVTTRCNNQEFLFQTEDDFILFLEKLQLGKQKYDVAIYAYSVMDNHVHLLVGTPFPSPQKENGKAKKKKGQNEKGPEDPTLSLFMQYVNGTYAQAYNREHDRSGHFWSERFHSTIIQTETQLFDTMLYIELNRVRCKAVQHPSEWKWSSYNAHAHGKHDPILDVHPLFLELGSTPEAREKAYREMCEARMIERGYKRDPRYTSGVVLGSESFVRGIIEEFGQKIRYYLNRKIYGSQEQGYSLYRPEQSAKSPG